MNQSRQVRFKLIIWELRVDAYFCDTVVCYVHADASTLLGHHKSKQTITCQSRVASRVSAQRACPRSDCRLNPLTRVKFTFSHPQPSQDIREDSNVYPGVLGLNGGLL